MKFLYSDEPIIAVSTCNLAHAAISVLRISGFNNLSDFAPFFEKILSGPIEPRRVYYTRLKDGDHYIDDICLTFFQGPRSYNGENILELTTHGNTLNVERIIDLFTKKAGLRLAQPGEFTYRALKNQKLTLSQVEGLDLFLNANSGYALDQGLSLLSGSLHEMYREIYELFIKHKAALELSIDFSDDIGDDAAQEQFNLTLSALMKKFETLKKRVEVQGQNLIEPEIVIAGLPNAGKSSLFNALLSDDRAIVSPIAGTTRDYLSESILIEGVKYKLFDTAGVREASDLIEAEGVRRTAQRLKTSFFSILLVNPFEMQPEFSQLITQKFDLILFTHSDLPRFSFKKDELLKQYPNLGPMGAVSFKLEADLEMLLSGINKKYLDAISEKPILLDRHKGLILQINLNLYKYNLLSKSERDIAILSSELNLLGHCISELVGIVSPDQVLGSIFSNFCIGK